MKKILITGSEGFVGQHLWAELEAHGYQVSGISHRTNIPPNTSVFTCNILDQDSLTKVIGDCRADIIFHLAAQAKPYLSFKQPQVTFEINTIGTINLFESIRSIDNYHPRIFLIGSSEEYGQVLEANLPIKEGHPFNPLNPYAASKVSNWLLASTYIRHYQLDIVYLVPFNHTGPGQLPGFIAPDIASQIASIEKTNQPGEVVTGNLHTKRDICDVRDVVRAYRLLIDNGKKGERYIICSGTPLLISSLVDQLISFSKVPIVIRTDINLVRSSDNPIFYGSYQKTHQTTGWRPEIPLQQTLLDLLNWYRHR